MSLKIRTYHSAESEAWEPKTSEEILLQHVLDMLALDRHILGMTVQQLNDEEIAKYPRVKSVLEKIHVTLVGQLSDLTRQGEALSIGRERGIKGTITKMAGQLAEVAGRARRSKVSKALRDQYGSLNMAAVGYEMLHATSLTLNDSQTAEIALRHLTEIAPIIVQLNQVVPETVARELRDEGKQVDSVTARQAIDNINTAWSKAAEQQISKEQRVPFEID